MHTFFHRLGKLLRLGIWLAGLTFVLLLLLAFTSFPARGISWLSRDAVETPNLQPTHIVVLGGGGIPSPTGLMRLWHAADLADTFPEARFVVSLPGTSAADMQAELELRGVDPARIDRENRAINTHQQATFLRQQLPADARLLLVTSPSHLKRSLRSFARAGFTQLSGRAALAAPVEGETGSFLAFRYGAWQNLQHEITFARECTALLWYRLRGWI